ncbi:LuxR C-terminal-related transcriptional regulator [Dyadobacter sp. 3J3]
MSINCTHLFTEREKQILEFIAKGFTSVAISEILIIS